MKYTRRWRSVIAHYTNIAESCQKLADDGWSVHTLLPSERVASPQNRQNDTGAIIVAFKDEPDLSGRGAAMSRRSRLWKATMRRRRHYAERNLPGAWSSWLIACDDLQDLAAMPFVRCARSWKRTPLRRAR